MYTNKNKKKICSVSLHASMSKVCCDVHTYYSNYHIRALVSIFIMTDPTGCCIEMAKQLKEYEIFNKH